jgi:membrane protease YdiL (CAAX protease family)
LVIGVVSGLGVDTILYALAAIVGAGAAAYALGQFRRETWRYLGLCLTTAGLLGVLIVIGGWYGTPTAPPPAVFQGIESLLLYIPVVFMMEEVAFRGAIDSHVRPPGERQGFESSSVYGVVSAIGVSVLWGVWHYPVIPLPPELADVSVIEHVYLVAQLEIVVGPFLSLFWRRSGNLMVPGFAHATIDSVRDALGGAPS